MTRVLMYWRIVRDFIRVMALVFLCSPAFAETRVIDGDTLMIDGERIRIYGLDCPEILHPLRGYDPGVRAKYALAVLLEGKTITLKRRGTDRYGRTVAKVFADGRDVTCSMIRAKVCREYVRYSKGEYEQCSR